MKYKHKIPLHLDVEDHILAGLSARQLLLMGAGLALGYLAWSSLSFLTATHWGMVMALLFSLLPALLGVVAAFFRPASRGLEEWTLVGLLFLAQPARLLWAELPEEAANDTEQTVSASETASEEKEEEEGWHTGKRLI
jgi:hypothetical protein